MRLGIDIRVLFMAIRFPRTPCRSFRVENCYRFLSSVARLGYISNQTPCGFDRRAQGLFGRPCFLWALPVRDVGRVCLKSWFPRLAGRFRVRAGSKVLSCCGVLDKQTASWVSRALGGLLFNCDASAIHVYGMESGDKVARQSISCVNPVT